MTSLFTNVSVQSALQTLTNASKNLSVTQNRVSTGYRINTAEDNAAYWSIATTLSAGAIGAIEARVDGNVAFVKSLLDANNRGIGQLVDADLSEESSKLKALQVQEQLAIQALSIANNASQNILRLSE